MSWCVELKPVPPIIILLTLCKEDDDFAFVVLPTSEFPKRPTATTQKYCLNELIFHRAFIVFKAVGKLVGGFCYLNRAMLTVSSLLYYANYLLGCSVIFTVEWHQSHLIVSNKHITYLKLFLYSLYNLSHVTQQWKW